MNPKYTSLVYVCYTLNFHTKNSLEDKAIGLILRMGKLRLRAVQ